MHMLDEKGKGLCKCKDMLSAVRIQIMYTYPDSKLCSYRTTSQSDANVHKAFNQVSDEKLDKCL